MKTTQVCTGNRLVFLFAPTFPLVAMTFFWVIFSSCVVSLENRRQKKALEAPSGTSCTPCLSVSETELPLNHPMLDHRANTYCSGFAFDLKNNPPMIEESNNMTHTFCTRSLYRLKPAGIPSKSMWEATFIR